MQLQSDYNPMTCLTLAVDMAATERRAFGVGRWRLRLAMLLIRTAARVLRCGITLTS